MAEVAPGPLPKSIPLVEREGVDEFGRPRSYVDGVALRSLLEHRRFEELTRYFEHFQSEFEADPAKELWPIVASASFSTAVPRLAPLFDEWVEATPQSFAPYLARAAYLLEVSWARRGQRFVADTPTENLEAMHETVRSALPDLAKARELRPQLMAAYRLEISALQLSGSKAAVRETMEAADSVCRDCYFVRSRYLNTLSPRWGGSYEQMQRVIDTLPSENNPALRLLAGYIDHDRAEVALLNDDLDAALRYAEAACARGPDAEFLGKRGDVHLRRGDRESAVADFTDALELRPDHAHLRIRRANAYVLGEQWAEAAEDLLAGLRIATTDNRGRRLLPPIFHGLVGMADAALEREEFGEALRLYDLAQALSPLPREISRRRVSAVLAGLTATPENIAGLEAALLEAPDDFTAHQRLDYLLADQGDFARIIALWSNYLERNPDDAAAYFERGGAYLRTQRNESAAADLNSACNRGLHAACAVATHFGMR